MKKKKSFVVLFSFIIAVLLFGCALMFTPKTAVYANPTSEETIDFGTDGITVDDQSKVNELITVIGGTSYNDLSTKLDSGVKDASSFASAKTVTLGGVEFNITYVSKADYTANGTNEGDIIVTLWMAESNIESQWGSNSANNPAAKYPMNMYSSSLIRSTLVGGNYLIWDGDETLDGTGVINQKWQPFNDGGAFYNCLATPANMAWQETLSAAQEVGFDNNCPNEAWGTPGSGSFANNFDFSLKQGYTDWKNDRIWLPAMSETGGRNSSNGLWNTNQTQRSNAGNASWLRSAAADEGMYAYYLNAAGVGYIDLTSMPKGVRPAVHLNLTSLYKFEVTVNDATTKYATIEEAFTYANGLSTDEDNPAEVKMFADAEISSTLTVATGKYITLDLNGCMLKLADGSSGSVITVKGNFTLIDSEKDLPQEYKTPHKYSVSTDDDTNGLWIFDEDNGDETLYGGVITGSNNDDYGGGVNVNGGTFTMESGTIAGNYVTYGGGGVYVRANGEFLMKNGAICGNYAKWGGGVYVGSATFTMEDGAICGNYAKWSGGVFVTENGTFTMKSGTISGNYSESSGGGVRVSGSFEISGAPIITGNTSDGTENNVHLYYTTTITTTITVIGKLEDGAKIGVYNTGAVATGYDQNDKPSKFFIPDNSANNCIYVSNTNGTVSIGTHDLADEWTTDENSHWHVCANGCGVKVDEADHSGTDDGDCTTALNCSVCGYEMKAAQNGHNFTTIWTTDENQHWKVCQNEGCTQTDTKVNHSGTDDNDCTTAVTCSCGYVITAAETAHDYATSWTTDENQHWHVCRNTDCTQTDTKVNHSGTDDNDCTTAVICSCGYEITAAETAHDYATSWTTDENKHWHVCNNCDVKGDEAAHEYNQEVVSNTYLKSAATCTAKAVYYKSCVCGKYGTEMFENGELVAHTPMEAVRENEVAATCSQAGSYDEVVYCSVCNHQISSTAKSIEKIAHTEEVIPAVSATCTAKGKTEGKKCSVCGEILIAQTETDMIAHTEVNDSAVAPTCTEEGKTAGKHCSVCNTVLVAQTTVAALGHDKVSHEAKAATCTEIGWNAYESCSRCDYTTYAETASLGHTEVTDSAVAPTCTEEGKTAGKHCSVCNTVLVAQTTVAALGHDKVSHEGKTATCTEIGWNAYESCSRCDYTTYAEIAALGHTEVTDSAIAPTCTEEGKSAGKRCSVCNTVLEAQTTVAALGHDYGEWTVVKQATETEDGEERRVCANDNAHYESRPLPKLTAPADNGGDVVEDKPHNGLSAGAIAGIVIGVIVFLLLAAYIACYFALYRRGILLKGKVFDVIYTPMNAIVGKKEQETK